MTLLSARDRSAAREIFEQEILSILPLNQSIDPPITIVRIAIILARHYSAPGRDEEVERLREASQALLLEVERIALAGRWKEFTEPLRAALAHAQSAGAVPDRGGE